MPKEFFVLIDKVVLFKVSCTKDQNYRFHHSFRVKKLCIDHNVIQKYSDASFNSVVCIDKYLSIFFLHLSNLL